MSPQVRKPWSVLLYVGRINKAMSTTFGSVVCWASLIGFMMGGFPVLGYAAPPLDSYKIDNSGVSVSGLSSGGYMAVQMHVAFSRTFMGAGALAGGPYYCAEGDQRHAHSQQFDPSSGRCMNGTTATLPPASHFRDLTENEAAAERIDATSNISGDRVWIFTGGADDIVFTRVVDRLNDYYKFYTDAVVYLRDELPSAQHAMITEDYGNSCSFLGDPYINDCDYDAAGELLQQIYGSLNAPTTAPTSNLKSYDQSAFSSTIYLGSEGYIYVPSACETGETTCKLHVAFHGCLQNRDNVGDKFARNAGYNQWAEANDIIVLYPQTSLTATYSCWDWWGFTDFGLEKKYHTRDGVLMAAVKGMIDRVMAAEVTGYCGTDSNASHVEVDRAYESVIFFFFTLYYAKGSDDFLGFAGATSTTLKETSEGHYVEVSSCP